MRCEECGFNNESSAKVCIKCGTKVNNSTGTSNSNEFKTVKGGLSSQPAWDASIHKPEAKFFSCPSCSHYPLESQVSQNYPCVNCGFTGLSENNRQFEESNINNEKPKVSPQKTGNKTVRLEDIFQEDSKPSFSLTEIKTGKTITLEGSDVEIGRNELDPENQAISTKHAKIVKNNGYWTLQDISSNKATFIQVDNSIALSNKTKIILGNKIFLFEEGD